jgi:hypothetical protein
MNAIDELTAAPVRKLTITCRGFKTIERGSLKGFASIHVRELRLTIHDVAVHESQGKRWAQLPSNPQLDMNRQPVIQNGKLAYTRILEFDSRAIAGAFSTAVIRALDKHQQIQRGDTP